MTLPPEPGVGEYFVCQACGEEFNSREEYKEHYRRDHCTDRAGDDLIGRVFCQSFEGINKACLVRGVDANGQLACFEATVTAYDGLNYEGRCYDTCHFETWTALADVRSMVNWLKAKVAETLPAQAESLGKMEEAALRERAVRKAGP